MGLWSLSNEIIVIYGGNQYAKAGTALKLFVIYMLVVTIDLVISKQILYVKRREKALLVFILIGGIINFTLNLILIYSKTISSETAILTTIIATSCLVIMELIYIYKKVEFTDKIFEFRNILYFVISIIFLPIKYIITLLTKNNFIVFSSMIMVCGMVYFFILWLIKDEAFIKVINRIKFHIHT